MTHSTVVEVGPFDYPWERVVGLWLLGVAQQIMRRAILLLVLILRAMRGHA